MEVKPIYTEGNRLTAPMVAQSTDNQLTFKQTCAILHFTITGEGQYNLVRVSNNGQERINGFGTIDLKNEKPVLAIPETMDESFRLTNYQDLDLDQERKAEYFFAIPECAMPDGFTLELMQVDREQENILAHLSKMTRKRLDARRGCMYSYEVDTSEMTQEEGRPDGFLPGNRRRQLDNQYELVYGCAHLNVVWHSGRDGAGYQY